MMTLEKKAYLYALSLFLLTVKSLTSSELFVVFLFFLVGQFCRNELSPFRAARYYYYYLFYENNFISD